MADASVSVTRVNFIFEPRSSFKEGQRGEEEGDKAPFRAPADILTSRTVRVGFSSRSSASLLHRKRNKKIKMNDYLRGLLREYLRAASAQLKVRGLTTSA